MSTESPTPTTGIELIAAERQRQIEQERFSLEHDDEYDDDELIEAARCYTISAEAYGYSPQCTTYDGYRPGEGSPEGWPWDRAWWKPTDRKRDLVKAGALIAAELDRIGRLDDGLNQDRPR